MKKDLEKHLNSYKEKECSNCNGTGWIVEGDYARECGCLKKRMAEKRLKQSGISEVFRTKTFHNYIYDTCKEKADAFIKVCKYAKTFEEIKETRNNSLLLCGQVGAGKTHLAIATANYLLDRECGVLYMPYRTEITKIKQLILDTEAYNKEMQTYQRAEVLLIDDLFKGKVTEADINIIYNIIDLRYFKGLPTIITTEKDIDGLLNIDEAIGSRIYEMCKGNVVTFENTPNYRLRN